MNEDFLVCNICTERYKTSKVLPCLHSFCEQCLRDLVEKTGRLDCPVCRRSHQLPEGGVAKLQRNVFLDNLIEQFDQSDSESSKSCDGCRCEAEEDIIRCLECSVKLCTHCARAHARLPPTRSHSLIAVAEYHRIMKTDPATVQPVIYCDVHIDKQVRFYCDTCEMPVCSYCTATDHPIPEHKHRYLQEASAEYEAILERTIEQLNIEGKKNDAIDAALQYKLDRFDVSFHAEKEKLKNRVTETIAEATRIIEDNGKQLLKQLRDKYKDEKGDFVEQLKILDTLKRDLSNARELSENLMLFGNGTHFMYVKKILTSQTEELLNVETKFNPSTSKFTMFQPYHDFCEKKSLGTVQIVDCTLEGAPELCRTGDLVCMALKVGGMVKITKDEIEAEITNPMMQGLKMTVKDKQEGRFTLMGRVEMEGQHRMLLKVCNQTVCCLPLKVVPQRELSVKFGFRGCSEIKGPYGLTVDMDGDTLLCDFLNDRVYTLKFNFEDEVAHLKKALQSKKFHPIFIGISNENKKFISEIKGKTVQVFDKDWNFLGSFKGKITHPRGIAVSPTNGLVYVADGISHCIHIFYQNGEQIKSFGNKGSENGYFISPEGVCVNSDGNVIVSDYDNHRIQVFDADGKFLFAFGSEGSSQGQMKYPCGITTDKNNNVYVCDHGNRRVLKFTQNGDYICRVDSAKAGLLSPVDVCVTGDDSIENVIVSDYEGSRVKVFRQVYIKLTFT